MTASDKTWDRVHNRPADIYTPPEDRVEPPSRQWTDARIREAFLDDGGRAEYYDPINGAKEQRRVAGEIFDTWLADHDAAVRRSPITDAQEAAAAKALWVAQSGDPEWAERVVEDVFSPADDWPLEALDMARYARAALEAARDAS